MCHAMIPRPSRRCTVASLSHFVSRQPTDLPIVDFTAQKHTLHHVSAPHPRTAFAPPSLPSYPGSSTLDSEDSLTANDHPCTSFAQHPERSHIFDSMRCKPGANRNPAASSCPGVRSLRIARRGSCHSSIALDRLV
jgi:hypothetical protein